MSISVVINEAFLTVQYKDSANIDIYITAALFSLLVHKIQLRLQLHYYY